MGKKSSFTGRNRDAATSERDAKKTSQATKEAETVAGATSTSKENQAAGQRSNTEATSDHIPVDFSAFILSLGTSALIHLGQEVDPASGRTSVDLPNARQIIDLLTLLEEKTHGNLTQEEENLVRQLLYTLRMKFVSLEKNQHA